MPLQDLGSNLWQRDAAAALLALRLHEHQFTVDALERLPNVQLPTLHVHIDPAQPECFPKPQTDRKRH